MKIFFCFLLISFLAKAQTFDYLQSGEDINSFASRNLEKKKIRYGKDVKAFIEDIKKWNLNIKNWANIESGTALYIDYPFPVYVPNTNYTENLKSGLHQSEENQNFSLFGFYTTSFGSYKETTEDQTVTSGQNFPITLGLGTSIANANRNHFLSASFYWAKPSSGKISGNSDSENSSINIPGEIGYNLYYQYYIPESLLGFYSGYDYENLNTFNTDQILIGDPIKNISNKMHYATLGISQSFDLKSIRLNTKLSFSEVLSSSTNGSKALTGHKYLVYLSLRPEGRFSYNLLYKHHDLKGPTNLAINRFGLSIGFQFF